MVEGHGLKWKGLQMKLIAFRKYIQEKTLPGDIVMMMDANDVLFVGEPQHILDAYQDLAAPIVASAERGCAPQGSGLEEDLLCADDGNDLLYPMPPKIPIFDNPEFDLSFRYLNSGTYMGDRDALLHLLDFYANTWQFECFNALGQAYSATRDQRCLTSFYIHCHAEGDIMLDHQQRIVSTMAAVPLSSYGVDEKGRLVNLASGHVTAMLHGNGWQAHLTKNEFFSKYEVVPGMEQ